MYIYIERERERERERENRKNKSPQNRLKYFHGYIQTVYFRGGGFRECPDKLL